MNYLLLKAIDVGSVFTVIGIVAAIALVLAILIILVSKLCFVKVDEKAEAITQKLSGANCGGCGFAGCADFAKALSEGKAEINGCSATSPENKAEIANILGVEFAGACQTFAVVKCAGGDKCKTSFNYVGNIDCNVLASVRKGNKLCSDGCLGQGSCVSACSNGGIKVIDGVAKINSKLCESCGVCVKICPKNLIELILTTAVVYVACTSKCRGKDVMTACEVGCIGCGLCAKNCPGNAITMVDNLPVIDYTKCSGCKTCVAKCPRHSIKEI
jgi:Na+-translocating ferredoxin:NAD+ oxidoreductase RNF subunit RnfB